MTTPNTNCRSRQQRNAFFLLRSFLRLWSILFAIIIPLFHSDDCRHHCQSNRNNRSNSSSSSSSSSSTFLPYFCEASATAATPTRQRPQNRLKGFLAEMTQTVSAVAGDAIRFKSIQKIDSEVNEEEPIGLSGYQADYNDDNDNDNDSDNDNGQRQQKLQYGRGESFVFSRFQSPACVRRAFDAVRSQKSFHWYEGKDGRKGYVSTTKLGGNYVLAESEQVAVDCTTEDVLRAYLSGKLQAKWNGNNMMATQFTKCKKLRHDEDSEDTEFDHNEFDNYERKPKPTRRNFWARMRSSFDLGSNGTTGTAVDEEKMIHPNYDQRIRPERSNVNDSSSTDENDEDDTIHTDEAVCDRYVYRQDLLLKSQRILLSHTGTMRYQQILEVDKVGKDSYTALVRLLKPKKTSPQNGGGGGGGDENDDDDNDDEASTKSFTTTAKKPFEYLQVYVGLEQAGDDVKIYAAGVFEVNRQVVPKIIVFDTSGFAGSLAGKGTLWLAAYFEQRAAQRKQMQARKQVRQKSSSSSSIDYG